MLLLELLRVRALRSRLASWRGSRSLRATPLVSIPFATSIVLGIGSPQGWTAAAAAGLAVLAMYVTGPFHPPAGINPLLVVKNKLPWSFLFAPVLAGALLLMAFAVVWHRWIRRRPRPRSWL